MRRSTSRIGKLPGEVLEEVNEKLYASWEYRRIRKWLFEEVAGEDVPALGLVKGEKFGLVWLRAGKSTEHARHHCELALGNWFRGWHQEWVKAKILRSEPLRMVRRVKMLTQEARIGSSPRSHPDLKVGVNSEREAGMNSAGETPAPLSDEVSIDGGDILMRSVLIDAISSVTSFGERSSSAGASAVAPGAMADKTADSRPPASAREIAQLAQAWARLKETSQADEKLRLKTVEGVKAGLDALYAEVKDDAEAIEAFEKFRDIVRRKRKQREKAGR